MDHKGTHLIVDLHGCRKRIESAVGILEDIARLAGLKVLARMNHRFPGGGETALLLLSESHCSIHSWPENGYAAFDLYSCGPLGAELLGRVLERLKEWLGSDDATTSLVQRH